ncbi:MAG: IclR family transcriptional regulator [Anaerolineae bacterium]
MKQNNYYSITAVEKALDVLETLGQQGRGLTLLELSNLLEIPKSTLFRYLLTLEARGYVEKDEANRKYELGLKAFELGSLAMARLTVREIALPLMHDLLDQFNETVNLAIRDQCDVLYIEILESPQAIKMASQVGKHDFIHATSLGKAILAFLPEEEVNSIAHTTGLPRRTENTITTLPELREELIRVRQRGYAIEDMENEYGARCVGAPIINRRGEAIAAMSIAGPADRFSKATMESMGDALLKATSQISQKLGYLSRGGKSSGR